MYGYRSENYGGSGVRDLAEIIYFEMVELGNTDILVHILQEGMLDKFPELKEETEDAIRLNEESSVLEADSTSEWQEYCNRLVQAISEYIGQDIKYGLWLTDMESCKQFYAGNNINSIDCYKTGEIILSDLGPDGKLYGYIDFPRPIEQQREEKSFSSERRISMNEIDGEWVKKNYHGESSFKIPDGVTKIGADAFNGINSLEYVILPNTVTEIGEAAFCCTGLREIVLPNSVRKIRSCSFAHNWQLERVYLPEGLKEIGEASFLMCCNLKKLSIPQSVETIGDTAFNPCENLAELSLKSNNPYFTCEDGILYNKDKTRLLCCIKKDKENIIIPDSVKEIDSSAFCCCQLLETIRIPQNIKIINEQTFEFCKSLETIIIPDGVAEIREESFACCDSLQNIYIPDSVSYINKDAFVCYDRKTTEHFPDKLVIICNKNSYAEKFAKDNGIPYKNAKEEKQQGEELA